MTLYRYLNWILLFFCIYVLFILFEGINYYRLVDPVYYINATIKSDTLSNTLLAGERWFNDVGFIAFSFLVNKLNFEPLNIGLAFSISILIISSIATLVFSNSKYYALLLLLFFINFTLVGLVLNVWRQGFACAFVLLSIFYPKGRLVFTLLAVTFHVNTALFFVLLYVLKSIEFKNILKFLPFLLITLIGGVIFLSQNQNLLESSVDTYAISSTKAPYLRFILAFGSFTICIFITWLYTERTFVKHILTEDIFHYIVYTLLIGMIFLMIIPAASERFMHYFFILFPFYVFTLLKYSSNLSRVIMIVFVAFYFILNFFLIKSSSTFQLIDYSGFL
ncbi:EpsG family protein [Vibrio cyclitrophicus]